MPLDPALLRAYDFGGEIEQVYTADDAILYALGAGYGLDPLDERQLRFVVEGDQLVAPTYAVVLGSPGFWARDPALGLDWVRLLHADQALELLGPLPPSGAVVGTTRVTRVVDRGEKGAWVSTERTVRDAATGVVVARALATVCLRGDGGFAGGDEPPPGPPATPDRSPDIAVDLPTSVQSALVYRLSGDRNPLHADPAVARAAGFERPILHGLCTFAVAGHALVRALCDYEPARLKRTFARFSAPVLPGDTLRTEIWRDGDDLRFRTRAIERDVVVLSHGSAVVA